MAWDDRGRNRWFTIRMDPVVGLVSPGCRPISLSRWWHVVEEVEGVAEEDGFAGRSAAFALSTRWRSWRDSSFRVVISLVWRCGRALEFEDPDAGRSAYVLARRSSPLGVDAMLGQSGFQFRAAVIWSPAPIHHRRKWCQQTHSCRCSRLVVVSATTPDHGSPELETGLPEHGVDSSGELRRAST